MRSAEAVTRNESERGGSGEALAADFRLPKCFFPKVSLTCLHEEVANGNIASDSSFEELIM